MVESRCAITMVVLPVISLSRASNTSFSEAASRPEVGSSSRRIGAFRIIARAIGEGHPALADDRIQALRQLFNEFHGVGQLCRVLDLLPRRFRLAIGNVLPYWPVKQNVILQDVADVLAQ